MDIIGIAVISLDGFITKHDEEGVSFGSKADQQFFREALQEFDCCIFGSKTFLASKTGILRNLTTQRLRIVLTRSPEKYATYQKTDRLEFTNASPEEILTALTRREKRRCAVLGGGEIYRLFVDLLDELWLTVEPGLFGTGTKLISEKTDVRLTLKEHRKIGENTLLLKYALKKGE